MASNPRQSRVLTRGRSAGIAVKQTASSQKSKQIIKTPRRHNSSTKVSNYPSSTKGLVIVIPPRVGRGIKRSRDVDIHEGEDETLIAIEGQCSKRFRQSRSCSLKDESSDETLISPAAAKKRTHKPKVSTRMLNKKRYTTTAVTQSCSYTGVFYLYAMDHQDLAETYRPKGASEPQYDALYHTLRSSSPNKLTARVTLPSTPYGRKFGSATADALCDPVSGVPYDIDITRISEVEKFSYKNHEKEWFAPSRYSTERERNIDVAKAGTMPGVIGKMGVAAGNKGVVESGGTFNLSRVWAEEDLDGKFMEIFNGYMSLRVGILDEYRRSGHGTNLDVGFAFWAVRGGVEI